MGIIKVNFSEVFNNKINVLFQNESIKINKQDLAIPIRLIPQMFNLSLNLVYMMILMVL